MRIVSSEMTSCLDEHELLVEAEVNSTYKVWVNFEIIEAERLVDVSFMTKQGDRFLSTNEDNRLSISDVKAILKAIKRILERVVKANPSWNYFCMPTTASRKRLYRRAGFKDYDRVTMIYSK